MVFPDDEREANPASFKFLEMAHKWKQMQAAKGGNSSLGALLSAPKSAPALTENAEESKEDSDSEMASSAGGD